MTETNTISPVMGHFFITAHVDGLTEQEKQTACDGAVIALRQNFKRKRAARSDAANLPETFPGTIEMTMVIDAGNGFTYRTTRWKDAEGENFTAEANFYAV